MSTLATTPAAILTAVLDTILGRLAILFLAATGGDLTEARQAASQMLAAYNTETPEELRLAAEIISFGLHALEALSQAADPGLSLARTLRLRGSAVSLSRESHKAQRKLDQLQRAGTQPQAEPARPQAEPAAAHPRPPAQQPDIDVTAALAEAQRLAKQIIARDGGTKWSQTYQKRLMAQRMAEKTRKNQAKQVSQANCLRPASPGPEPAQAAA